MSTVSLAFDRGSVVVRGLPRQVDLTTIPEVVWDARAGAYRAPARVFYALAAELRRRCFPLAEHPLPRLIHPASHQSPPLHAHQRAALAAWRLARGRAVLSLPPGGARLDLALAAIVSTGTPALVLVSSPTEVEQWTTALRRLGITVGSPDQGRSEYGALVPVTVTTFATAHRDVWWMGDRFGLLIVDQADRCGRGFPDEVLEMCTAPLRLGFAEGGLPTGSVGQRIETLMGPEVFALLAAEETGDFQPPFHRLSWSLKVDPGERRLGDGGLRVPLPRCQQHALALLLDYHRAQRSLVFAPDLPTASAVAREHLLPVLDLAGQERMATVAAFRAGKLPALVVLQDHRLRTEDELPAADVGIVVGKGAGETSRGREAGCLLRPARGSRGLVYQLVLADGGSDRPLALVSAA